jgi:hypothetical protein
MQLYCINIGGNGQQGSSAPIIGVVNLDGTSNIKGIVHYSVPKDQVCLIYILISLYRS